MPQFPATIELADLDGTNGFQINGEAAGDQSGGSVSDAGDVNGDGFDDLLIGTFKDYRTSGASYVVFGKASGFAATLELSSLDGTNGFEINGEAAGDQSGHAVSAAGDVNGDGIDDMIVGAAGVDVNGLGVGASYVVFGRHTGFAATLDLATLDGENGFQICGEEKLSNFGRRVSSAGDINGDGFSDLLISADTADPNGLYSGAAYVVFGRASVFTSNLSVSDLNGANGFQMNGPRPYSFAGSSVSDAGDFNGDGVDDLLIGANEEGRLSGGRAYVVFGKDALSLGFGAVVELSNLYPEGETLYGESSSDMFGISVAAAGDINGDGRDDFVIGAPLAGINGVSYVYYGRGNDGSSSLPRSRVVDSNYDDLVGGRVSGAGDLNGDGFDDIVIVSERSNSVYVVFGSASGIPSDFDLATVDGSNGFKIAGGADASSAGDVNGDGFDDVIIGSVRASPNGSMSGASYVVFGHATCAVDRTGTNGRDFLSGGEWNDQFNGLGGNDVIRAGAGNDYVDGGSGDDCLELGAGHDNVIVSSGGNDEMFAGAGTDTMDFRRLGVAAIALDMLGCVAVLANGDTMSFCDFERARGTKGDDTILGDHRNNSLLEGNKGNDIIDGRGGADFIAGNGGKDVLTGGDGTDRFDFNLVTDSGTSAATRDVITDFKRGGADKIDLATIDAIAGGGTANDTFAFISGAFTAAGQVRAVQSGGDTIIEVNTSGAGGSEMTILLKGVVAASIVEADFWL